MMVQGRNMFLWFNSLIKPADLHLTIRDRNDTSLSEPAPLYLLDYSVWHRDL